MKGNSGFDSSGGRAMGPGVWASRLKRARRRLSASWALTGSSSLAGRRGARRDRRSPRWNETTRCPRCRMSAASEPECSDAGRTGAARRDSGRLRPLPGRDAAAVAQDYVTVADRAGDFDLESFDGRIHVARGASGGHFFAHDVPGFQGVAQLEVTPAAVTEPIGGKRNSKCGANHSFLIGYPAARSSSKISCQSSSTKWGSMKRSCSAVPQGISLRR